MSEQLELLRQAKVIFGDVLENVTPDQMSLPTVNDDWDVRGLINHVVMGNQWSAENVRTGNAPRPSGDAIGGRDPRQAYAESAAAMIAAFEEPGALDRMVQMPFGEMTVSGLAGMRFTDLASHAWDLAKATGQPADLSPVLCEAALTVARRRLGGRDRAQTPFKDEVPVPTDAPAADRLAGYLGKKV